MRAAEDVYWSIEHCGWVAAPGRSAGIPDPRRPGAEEPGSSDREVAPPGPSRAAPGRDVHPARS